jgi:hypothetical protein
VAGPCVADGGGEPKLRRRVTLRPSPAPDMAGFGIPAARPVQQAVTKGEGGGEGWSFGIVEAEGGSGSGARAPAATGARPAVAGAYPRLLLAARAGGSRRLLQRRSTSDWARRRRCRRNRARERRGGGGCSRLGGGGFRRGAEEGNAGFLLHAGSQKRSNDRVRAPFTHMRRAGGGKYG